MARGRGREVQPTLFDLPTGLYVVEAEAWERGLVVAGLDEVGRGPLAGPVIAAAVVLDPSRQIEGLRDSKLLTARQRERLAAAIRERAGAWAVGRVGPRRIERLNVLNATWRAMRLALGRLRPAPTLVLVDGPLRIPGLRVSQRALVGGDRRSASIAAASILAKVARDRLMRAADRRYPGYGFREHKGYATEVHRAALARLGPCPLHRGTFHGVGRPADPEEPLLPFGPPGRPEARISPGEGGPAGA